jgi:hypothetical protein
MKHDTKHEAPSAEAPKPEAPSTEAPKGITPLPANATLADVIAKVNELAARSAARRDRGPESTKQMTEDDARRCMLGDLKEASHTKAAEALGLSYGQVYSARKGFTHKPIYKQSDKRW